ncbi:MAG: NAD(P)-dependent oxidoreductase [Firmicutes bacterium]|nr:NAD(P)-dependent oxidoreductase [Bacillota bacterium]
MERLLITGVLGCIGAWIARVALDEGHTVIGVDVSGERHRLQRLGVDGRFALEDVDVRDRSGLEELVRQRRPTAIVHLAALQIPSCRANPFRCAEVNVGGMGNVLELARKFGLPLVYASSAAVYGPGPSGPLAEDEGINPHSLYGVFKRTNEDMARLYAHEYGVTCAGLRPWVVYGPGRDAGMTGDITLALWHAMRGEPYRIRFSGTVDLQYAEDVARAFVTAALNPKPGARVYNLRGEVASVDDAIKTIERLTGTKGLISYEPTPIPIAADLSDARFQEDFGPFPFRSFEEGLRETLRIWRDNPGSDERPKVL